MNFTSLVLSFIIHKASSYIRNGFFLAPDLDIDYQDHLPRVHMNISVIKVGEEATVTEIDASADAEIILRLRALGLVVGATVIVERKLPFGGPIVVRFGGGAFALEPQAAKFVRVVLKEKI